MVRNPLTGFARFRNGLFCHSLRVNVGLAFAKLDNLFDAPNMGTRVPNFWSQFRRTDVLIRRRDVEN